MIRLRQRLTGIMNSMVPEFFRNKKTGGFRMDEKTFKTITGTGVINLVTGILAIVGGVAVGVLLLISGARLLKSRSKVMI